MVKDSKSSLVKLHVKYFIELTRKVVRVHPLAENQQKLTVPVQISTQLAVLVDTFHLLQKQQTANYK